MGANIPRQHMTAPPYAITSPLAAAQQTLGMPAYPGVPQLPGVGGLPQMTDAATLEQLRIRHYALLNVIKNHERAMAIQQQQQQQQQPQALPNPHVAVCHPVPQVQQ
mmetsp:Transcript_27780/g.32888  ORF Transcript_27780/g.32888 Transcript_27780/m.32888 type:complete len:107 (+) Transcript_27780:477-797(+)|eukprot:CAMPEP_0198261840 /NCGR_PEP_ID=MMETSP1447-20131203/10483_1 /TAXON_ID=420782 /ORGANISM="Chaetoceros dichaeta, Strain CCMP1751" /LENGTH=106 /DNA_ID=CAMNT_0043949885 /DNA_START=537 /DNA_END=857 /DNA_ORIENTATION=+